MKTLLLDGDVWDLVVDAHHNIAVASNPYSQAQDAASAIKLFSGELYYDTTKGIPYFTEILGKLPPLALIKEKFNDAALSVPGVLAAQSFVSSLVGRQLTGQVQIENEDSQTSAASF